MKKYKMSSEERDVYDNLSSKDKKMYACMTGTQRKRYSKMSGKTAERYMYACMTENEKYTGKKLMEEVLSFVKEPDGNMSHANEEVEEKNFKCKYCGTGFSTQEKVEKHQKTCMV
jgi:uncharacterized protein YwqG